MVLGTEKTLRKGMGSWWRDGHVCRAKGVSFRRKCDRVVGHVFSNAFERERALALEYGESGESQTMNVEGDEGHMDKDDIAGDGHLGGPCPGTGRPLDEGATVVSEMLRSFLRWRTTTWWETRSAWGMRVVPKSV